MFNWRLLFSLAIQVWAKQKNGLALHSSECILKLNMTDTQLWNVVRTYNVRNVKLHWKMKFFFSLRSLKNVDTLMSHHAAQPALQRQV